MNREQFLARAVQTKEVALDDDSVIKIRKLTQADVETLTSKFASKGGDVLKGMEGFRFIVMRTVVNDNGERMFAEADKEIIKEMPTDLVQTIAKEACAFSGLSVNQTADEDEEAATKND